MKSPKWFRQDPDGAGINVHFDCFYIPAATGTEKEGTEAIPNFVKLDETLRKKLATKECLD